MKNVKKIALFSFALVLGVLTFVNFATKADETATPTCVLGSVEVTFDWNGPDVTNYVAKNVCLGETLKEIPEIPDYPGYTFVNYTNDGNVIDATTNIAWGTEKSYTLTANWKPNVVKLQFVYDGALLPTAPSLESTEVNSNFPLTSFNEIAKNKTPEGKQFNGWTYDLNDDKGLIIAPDVETFKVPAMAVDSTLVLTVSYIDIPKTTTINISLPEGVTWVQDYTWVTEYKEGQKINLPTAEVLIIKDSTKALSGWQVISGEPVPEPGTKNNKIMEPGYEYSVPAESVTLAAVLKDVPNPIEPPIVEPPVVPGDGEDIESIETITTIPKTGSNAMFMAIAAIITTTSLVIIKRLNV